MCVRACVCVHRCVSVCVYTRNVCEKHWRSGRELMCSCDHYSGFSQCWYKSINQRWLELNHTHVFMYWISKRSYNEQKNGQDYIIKHSSVDSEWLHTVPFFMFLTSKYSETSQLCEYIYFFLFIPLIKAVFSASLLQSSVSHDLSEIILICRFAAQ